jgi:hypothetical protein
MMDLSIWLGVLGIVVSVIFGMISYRVTDQRTTNQKHRTAKAALLQELSKSLGEDAIPSPKIIQATLNSILRETGAAEIRIDVDEVLDDLMRQVTADPFLDGERRRKLQCDIERVRSDSRDVNLQLPRAAAQEARYGRLETVSSVATLIGLLTTFVVGLATFIILGRILPEIVATSELVRLVDNKENLMILLTLISGVLFLLPIAFKALARKREAQGSMLSLQKEEK